jgi:hypothetical protein
MGGLPGWRRGTMAIYPLAISLVGIYFSCLFLTIPINTEARDYIFHNGYFGEIVSYTGWVTRQDFWGPLINPIGANSRVVSMVAFEFSHGACGLNAVCLNSIQILELLAGTIACTVHLHQVIRRPAIVAGAMVFWSLSLPVSSAGFWQATQHDKLALVFAFTALSLGLWAIRHTRVKGGLIAGVMLTILFALAINSKEIAFFLPVAAAAQVSFLAPMSGLRERLHAASVYAVPVVYSAYYMFAYMHRMNPQWGHHVFAGSFRDNFGFYFGSLTGSHRSWAPAAACISVLASVSLHIVVRRGWLPRPHIASETGVRDPSFACLTGYLVTVWLATMALVIGAQYPGDYYLLVTEWAFISWVAVTIVAAEQFPRTIRYVVVAAAGGLSIAFFLGRSREFGASDGDWQRIREAHLLGAGYETIGRYCSPPMVDGLKLVFPLQPAASWFFFRGGDEHPDQLVGAYICNDGQSPAMTYSFNGSEQPDRPGQVVAIWNRALAVQKITRDGALLYRMAAAPHVDD